MRRLSSLLVVLVVLFVGGALTTLLSGNGTAGVLPVVKQADDPAASTLEADPVQARQLFLLASLVLFGVFGIGGGIALVMWFLSCQIVLVKAMPARISPEPASTEEFLSS